MHTAAQEQTPEDLGPADFFDAVSTEYRPLPAGPAVILYLAVPVLAVPALIVGAVVVPVVLAVRIARGDQVRTAVRSLLRAAGRLLSAPTAVQRCPEASRVTPYSATVARSLSVARAGLRSR